MLRLEFCYHSRLMRSIRNHSFRRGPRITISKKKGSGCSERREMFKAKSKIEGELFAEGSKSFFCSVQFADVADLVVGGTQKLSNNDHQMTVLSYLCFPEQWIP